MRKKSLLLALALCLTTTSSIFAIGGVDSPPLPAARHETKFASPEETKLDNGLRVIVVHRPGLPLLYAQVQIGQGAAADPPGLAGTATLTGELLTKGTESMSAPEIARTVESLGGSIGSGAGRETSAAYLAVMSNQVEPAFKILADVVLHPIFRQDEIDRLKNQRLDFLRVSLQQPGSLARYVTARSVFGSGAYGHAANGTLETLPKISRDNVVTFYQRYFKPSQATVILAGDITLAKARTLSEKFFNGWRNTGDAPNEEINSGAASWKPENLVIDMPEAGQAAVTTARPAIARSSPEYYTAIVVNSAFGSGLASRLNREIRIKRGLSYGAASSIEARRQPGLFSATAQTKNESAAEVAKLMQSELKRMVTDPVDGKELQGRKAVLTGGYARNLETNEGFVAQISELAAYHLPLNILDKYIPSIDAVTSAEVTDFARKYLAQPMSLVIVGKAAAFLEALKKSTPAVKVIEQKNLDLNQPDLTREGP